MYPSSVQAAATPQLQLLPNLLCCSCHRQAGGGRIMGKELLPKPSPAPRDKAGGGSTSALLFSGLNSKEDSIRITPLQLLQAPHQACTPIYIHISAPTSGCHQTYRASLPHQEKRIFLHCIPSCGSSFYRRMLLAQQNACTPLCSETCDKSYPQYRDFPLNLCFFLKASSQSARH